MNLYRVWSCRDNRYLENAVVTPNGDLLLFNKSKQAYVKTDYVSDADFKVERYMGFTDYNGSPIYEGDLVAKVKYHPRLCGKDKKYNTLKRQKRILKEYVNHFGRPMYNFISDEQLLVTSNNAPVCWLEGEDFGYEGEGLVDPKMTVVVGHIHENTMKGE